MNRGEDSEAISTENEETEKKKERQIFNRARAVIVRDLKKLRLVFFNFRGGSYGRL